MNPPHQGPHQPLNVSPEARRGRRAILNTDTVLLAPTLEGARMKLRTIVDMNDFR
jgi:hypothetical protein